MNLESKADLNQLLRQCLKKDRKAQKHLYEQFGPLMKVVCKRYLFDTSKAEEVMNQGFLKVFTHLQSFNGAGSFEGWVRRIMVNECLNENRKRHVFYQLDDYSEDLFLKSAPEIELVNDADYLLRLIGTLPMGYRLVFNMVEIEGFSYKEVSKEIGASEGACRARLSRAKQLLRQMIEQRQEKKTEKVLKA